MLEEVYPSPKQSEAIMIKSRELFGLLSILFLLTEVRAEINTELVAKSIDFMKRQKSAGKPFFLFMGRIGLQGSKITTINVD